MKDNKRGIGLKYAIDGLKTVFINERNFKIHLMAFIVVVIIGLFFKLSLIEWSLIIIGSALVIIIEIVNSVIELMIDYIKPEKHPSAKMIKDMSASAVLVAVICAIIIGLIIFIPKILF